MTYLFILLAKRFSCSLLCCCVYLFVCVVWIVYTLMSFCIFFFFWRNLIRFSLFYRIICIRVVCPNFYRLISLNVRGIRVQIKRRSIFSHLRDHKANIYFIQETFRTSRWKYSEKNWASELFFSHGTTHSKGVCILINPFVQPKVDYSYANDLVNDSVVS